MASLEAAENMAEQDRQGLDTACLEGILDMASAYLVDTSSPCLDDLDSEDDEDGTLDATMIVMAAALASLLEARSMMTTTTKPFHLVNHQ